MGLFAYLATAVAVLSIAFQGVYASSDLVRYRTQGGNCPTRSVKELAMILVKDYEKNHSLKSLKEKMLQDELPAKHYLSEYRIDYNPVASSLLFRFECPRPLMRVQVYKENRQESYQAVLVENGKLFDAIYESLLRQDRKLARELPSLAMPVSGIDENRQMAMTDLFNTLDVNFRQKVSEMIINENSELTVILAIRGHATSAFLGTDSWIEKINKLQKIIDHLQTKERVPSVINLTNSKKIVVKFPSKS